MALIHCNFFSETLGMATSMDVVLPGDAKARSEEDVADPAETEHPCLTLLHGLSDDHTIWQRRTSIERYASPLGLAVIMPNVHRSFYTDMANGYRYWTFVSEELPALARSFFRLSTRREDNFVAGLSMGGYGAFKLALRYPERFAAAASLSGVLDLAGRAELDDDRHTADLRLVFGSDPKISGTEDDLLYCAQKLAESDGPRPRFYQCCGTCDFLYENNLCFRDHALKLGLDLTYEEDPADHEWGYWDRKIQTVLRWLFVGREQ